jgi:hypothetical protein
MAEDPDPPRKFYALKPKEFERVNPPAPQSAPVDLRADPGVAPTTSGRIDVRDITRQAAQGVPLLDGTNAARNRTNEVHATLRGNFARDVHAGWFHVEAGPDKKRRRRVRNYWLLLAVVDLPLGWFAWKLGPGAAIPYVCALGGIGMFTAVLTWHTWFLRTE